MSTASTQLESDRALRLSELASGGAVHSAALSQLLWSLFDQGYCPFRADCNSRELFAYWLLAIAPAEFKLDDGEFSADADEYEENAAAVGSLLPQCLLPPFMKLVALRNFWILEQWDLGTDEGLASYCRWLFENDRFADLVRHPIAREEVLHWANAPANLHGISRIMSILWNSRSDLKVAYDIASLKGAQGYIEWFAERAATELGLTSLVIPTKRSEAKPNSLLRQVAKAVFGRSRAQAEAEVLPKAMPERGYDRESDDSVEQTDFTVVGSFTGEFGVGQHARSVAESLDAAGSIVTLLNAKLGPHDHSNTTYNHRFATHTCNEINLLCLNVMSGLDGMRDVGADKFFSKYNILYGYWELSRCPTAWNPYLALYDEFWAPTKFIADALSASTDRTVHHMPISVTVDEKPVMSREELGLPLDRFLFLFHFDAFSFARRKNAQAAIRAFKQAFPGGNENVGLVIKTKHLPTDFLRELTALIDDDKRVVFLSGDFSREKIIALEKACDAYISLHRSEGFGMGPAEMMYLGKPVVVTNYSGNTDFTVASNSCLVDYQLVAVNEGDYAFYEPGQVWADPDVDQAAWYLRKLVAEPAYANQIGSAARAFILEQHNPKVIGTRYQERIAAIRKERSN